MGIIRAIFENGVFRPTDTVDLPDKSEVEFEPRLRQPLNREPPKINPTIDPALKKIYEIMGEQFSSGFTDTAARHNEHQP